MLKILFCTVIGIFLITGILLVALSISSRKQPTLGLVHGQLASCPATPNCVCSEQPHHQVFVEPLHYSIAFDDAWRQIKRAIHDTGGVVITEHNGYLHAQYVTPLMRYIDDVEFRIDDDKHLIHIRSASRVGHSDMGANRARVNRIRTMFDNY